MDTFGENDAVFGANDEPAQAAADFGADDAVFGADDVAVGPVIEPTQDDTGDFMRGLKGSLMNQQPEDLANAVEGIQYLTDFGLDDQTGAADPTISDAIRAVGKSGVQYDRKVPSFSDIKGPSDALTYVLESAGAGLGSTIPSLVTGAAGAFAGKKAAGNKGMMAGSIAGAALPSAEANFGQLYAALREEGIEPNRASEWAAGATVPITALDVASPTSWIARLTGDAKRTAIRSLAKRIVQEAAKGFLMEGSTEAAQQGIQAGTVAAATEKTPFTWENAKEVTDSFLQGGLGGGTMGGALAVVPDAAEAAPPAAAPAAAREPRLGPVAQSPLVGAIVGLKTPDGPVRVRVDAVQDGNVFYRHPDGTVFGMPADDFSSSVVVAPEAEQPNRGDATTVPEQPPRAEPTDYGDINDFDPNAQPPLPPKPPTPQQAIELADTREIDRTARAAREFRKAAVESTDPVRAAHLNSQADALDNEAIDLRQKLSVKQSQIAPGSGVPAANVRASAEMGDLGSAAPAANEAVTGQQPVNVRAAATPLDRAAAGVPTEAQTGPVAVNVRAATMPLDRAAAGVVTEDQSGPAPAPVVKAAPTALDMATQAIPTEATHGQQPVTVRPAPTKMDIATQAVPTEATGAAVPVVPKPKPSVQKLVNDRLAPLNDPQKISRMTGVPVDQVKAELARMAASPKSPIRQVKGTTRVDPKTNLPVQSKRAGLLTYKPVVQTPVSLLEALSAAGGVQDRGQDLKSMGADTWHRGKVGKRPLLSEKGIALDELGDWALDNGYLPARDVSDRENNHVDPQEVIDLIGRELAGQKQYTLDDQGSIALDTQPEPTAAEQQADRAEKVRDDLGRLGEVPSDTATLEDLEYQLDERLGQIGASNVDEAIRMIEDDLASIDRTTGDEYGDWNSENQDAAGQSDEAARGVSENPERSGSAREEESGRTPSVENRGRDGSEAAREDGVRPSARSGVDSEPDANASLRDQTFELEQFASGRNINSLGAARQLAVDYVVDSGKSTGNEYMVAIDSASGVIEATTSDLPGSVAYSDEMWDAINDPDNSVEFVHNHPNDTGLSAADISLLAFPGLSSITSVGHNGFSTKASLTEAAARWLSGYRSDAAVKMLSNIFNIAEIAAANSLKGSRFFKVWPGRTREIAVSTATLRALSDAGLIDYVSNRKPRFPFSVALNKAAAAATKEIDDVKVEIQASGKGNSRATDRGSSGGRPAGRSSQRILDENGSDRTDVGVSERPSGKANDNRYLRAGNETDRSVIQRVVDSFRGNPGTAKSNAQQVNRAGNAKGPIEIKSLSKIANLISFAATVASKDAVSARYYVAEKAMNRRGEELVREAATDTDQYFGDQVGADGRDKINAVLEHDRLAGIDRKDTGKRVVVRMPENYTGTLAKPGDVVALNQVESRALAQLRSFFDKRWEQFGNAMAKQFGYDGPMDKASIQKAIDDAPDARTRKRAERAASILQSVDAMRRSGYVPFARYGDTKISIRAKAKEEPGKDGMQFGRAEHVELVPSKSILDDFISRSTPSKTVAERVRELEKKFPRDKYDYDVASLNSISDIKKLDLPMVEKMMMIVNLKNPKMAEGEFEKIVDSIFEERKAGFRKQSLNVPGYSNDFERAIADYIHQTSSVIARMEQGRGVEDAFEATQQHPDEAVSKFWKDYRDYIDTPGEEFTTLRKIAFWKFIWGSLASAVTNLTQTPLVTVMQVGSWGGPRSLPALGGAITEAMEAIRVGKNGLDIDWSKIGRTPGERAMVAKLRAEGVLDPVIAKDLQGAGVGTTRSNRKWLKGFNRAYDIGASAFNLAEMANRIGAALGTYRLAQNKALMDKARKVYAQDAEFQAAVGRTGTPLDLARFMVDETQFMGGKRGRNRVMRGAGSLLLQWKQYQANWMRLLYKNMTRMGPEGKIAGTTMLIALVATAGVLGVPFGEDLLDAVEWGIKTATGIDPMLERQAARVLRDIGLGEVGAEAVLRGGSRSLTGLDLGSRLGMGNMVPDSGIENMFPLLGATVGAGTEFVDRAKSGQDLGAATVLMPKGLADLSKGAAVLPSEGYRTKKGDVNLFPDEIKAGEMIARAFGFQPARFSRITEFKYAQRRLQAATQDASSQLLGNVASALAMATQAQKSGDEANYRKHMDRYLELLRENAAELSDPDLPAWKKIPQPSAQAIRNRVKSMLDFETSTLKRTKKSARGEAQDYPLPKE